MGLNAALVDQARVVRQDSVGVKVRGSTVFAPTHGEWFKCRLTLPEGTESTDGSQSRRRVIREPRLLCGMKDKAGNQLALNVEERLEVDSKNLGRAIWDVVSQPGPLRKKRRVIGFEFTLRRVEDAELPDAAT